MLARGSKIAGLSAAFFFAIYPGSVYYGRTFMPDTAMIFFFTAALYASMRWIDEGSGSRRGFWPAALLTACAFLAKPVAVVALIPIAAFMLARWGIVGTLKRPLAYAF